MNVAKLVNDAANRGMTPPLATATEEVDAVIAQLDGKRRGLEAERGEVAQQIVRVQAALGEAYLSGNLSAGAELPSLRARIEAINAALAHLARRREILLVDRQRAELVDIDRDLERFRAELAGLESATAPLLERLSALEGIPFDQSVLLAQRSGAWVASLVNNYPPGELRHCELMAPNETVPDIGGIYLVPRRRRLRIAIHNAEVRAERIRQSLDPPADQPRSAAAEMLARHNFHPQPPAPKIPTVTVTERGVHFDDACKAEEAAAKERDRVARGLKMDGQDAVEATRRAAEDKRA